VIDIVVLRLTGNLMFACVFVQTIPDNIEKKEE